ncbi:UDP-N-acetylenolpyruvoylglucosamine reductase [Mangrovactinospora gilvigrisea]|uniref:UDP-N-acetylenolpyruvoylglucosamine reductase n=1 Tax=Mangrovactinospora gilvigrisea TaxID=1428644 RepID=A0A1J7CCK7_9ACTN|nr:UDP-N-acetylmuramate dehydrogenase [Mangrovactinospora gilvigrisea]OIV39264.1 UDP-N-acetylenolpyruvoylglucosamine reductase [Mangrovactinospora gilvigrisea]
MQATENAPLAPLTTLRCGGPARRLVEPETDAEVAEALADAERRGDPLLVLGGGSNLVVAESGFPGTVLRLATRGIEIDRSAGVLTAAAGERWTDVVDAAVDAGLAGIECLAGIPGSAGATPIQNVGAYGQEVAETVTEVVALDRRTGATVAVPAAECRFAYRDSLFKQLAAVGDQRYVVLRVRYALQDAGGRSAPIAYDQTARALGVALGDQVPLGTAAEAVLALRRSKSMVLDPDDHDSWSAGSFFTNPVVDGPGRVAFLERVRTRLGAETAEAAPNWPAPGGRTKLSAAWLIERAGFPKGYGTGPAGISTKHTLALTNRGGATAEDVLALAREVRDGVREAFGVQLVNEPVLVGAKL